MMIVLSETLARDFDPYQSGGGISRVHRNVHHWAYASRSGDWHRKRNLAFREMLDGGVGGEEERGDKKNPNSNQRKTRRLVLFRVPHDVGASSSSGSSAVVVPGVVQRFPSRDQELMERCMETEFGPLFAAVAREVHQRQFERREDYPAPTYADVFLSCAFWSQLLLYDVEDVLFPVSVSVPVPVRNDNHQPPGN